MCFDIGHLVGRVAMETSDPVLRRIPASFRSAAVLFGGVMCMITLGTVYTFGNMLPYMVSYFRWKINPSMTSGSLIWLQTLMSGFPMGMVVGGVLERSLGGRKAAAIGTFLYTTGIAATYFTIQHSYAATLFSMGVVASMGSSIAYNSILPTAQRWLPDNVGMAGGIIIGGYGCGAFILSPMQTTFINPLDYQVNKDGFFTQEDLLERVPAVFLVMASFFFCCQIIGLILIGQPREDIEIENDSLIGTEEQAQVEKLRISQQLRTSTFAVLFLSLTCNALWVQLTSGLYKTFGQQFISSDFFLSMIGSMSSIFNAGSRVAWGAFADFSSYQFSMVIVCTVGATLSWILPTIKFISNDLLFLVSVCLMFSCVGGTFSLFPYVTHKLAHCRSQAFSLDSSHNFYFPSEMWMLIVIHVAFPFLLTHYLICCSKKSKKELPDVPSSKHLKQPPSPDAKPSPRKDVPPTPVFVPQKDLPIPSLASVPSTGSVGSVPPTLPAVSKQSAESVAKMPKTVKSAEQVNQLKSRSGRKQSRSTGPGKDQPFAWDINVPAPEEAQGTDLGSDDDGDNPLANENLQKKLLTDMACGTLANKIRAKPSTTGDKKQPKSEEQPTTPGKPKPRGNSALLPPTNTS
ncbi:unnamed protein product [Caenorhabditis auriculariae]|uniref:Major facilitator superfamily (MFS) profile domain-containing protein n=1 Tax=Caenorhabditis auriculariae TaxID=2777116 RepID=A0A8S1H9E2_9PELO|nr:unnamed protein product [Caenorhabditis auriculariae]